MLKKILGNTLISVILVVLSVVYIIATFRMRTEWWMNFDMLHYPFLVTTRWI